MWRTVGWTGFVGIQLLLALGIGWYAGEWLDSKLGTAPWCKWIGTAMGVGVSIQLLVLVVRQYKKSLQEEDAKAHDRPGPN